MQLEDLEDSLDEYGTDLDDWPEGLRLAALALLDTSADARGLVERERALDAALLASHAKPVTAPAGLANRIVLAALDLSPAPAAPVADTPVVRAAIVIPPPSPWQRALVWLNAQLATPGMGYAAILLVCFAGGLATSQVLSVSRADATPAYIAGLYADLAY